ncbi:MAG: peptide chain release factor-like protein [Chloroflexi bacterium]|nr:peptide chain release factor-like protein [Chloroflexota bacterium]
MSHSSSPDNPTSSSSSSSDSDWLTLSDEQLLAQCRLERFRVSGPGGQHRNRTDSAVRLTHEPSGAVGYASERRSQHQNRAMALSRLRRAIALEVRRDIKLDMYHPPLALQRVLPRSIRTEVPGKDRVGPRHREFWTGIGPLLDLFEAVGGSTADCAALIGCSSNQLTKLFASEPHLWAAANAARARFGLNPLRR